MKKIIIIIVFMLFLTGCSVAESQENQQWVVGETVIEEFRPYDNIICFVSDGYHSGGISCLLLNQPN